MKLNTKQDDRTLHVSSADGKVTIREREREHFINYRNRWHETYITISLDEARKLAAFILDTSHTEKAGQQ